MGGTFIGMKCYFDDVCPENMIIEDHVIISYGVYFSCHGRRQGHHTITIRRDAYIGFRSVIHARHDLEIGERAMIGAMSFVNRSIPADTTAVGHPAKVVKEVGDPIENTEYGRKLMKEKRSIDKKEEK